MESFESSAVMKKAKLEKREAIPFDELEIGKSFVISVDEMNESSLRTAASCACKKFGKIFRVKKHADQGIFEIGRLPDKMEEPEPLKQWDSSPQMKGE